MSDSLSLPAKLLLLGAGVLSVITGPVLFLLPDLTSVYFAWTIKNPMTAVFMGACYLTAGVGVLLSLRTNRWSVARLLMPAVIVFATTMLLATLLHSDIFNWSHPVAWAWLAVYVASPPAGLVIFLLTERSAHPLKLAGPPLSPVFTRGLGLFTVLLALVGLMAFLFPSTLAPFWGWNLTPLTARVVGGWILTIAALTGMLARNPFPEVGWILQLSIALVSSLVLLGAIVQRQDLTGPSFSVGVYVLFFGLLGAFAVSGWWQTHRRPVPNSR